MLKRLSDELQSRVSKGSDILVAVADEAESGVEAEGLIDATGQYVEPGLPCVTPRMPPTNTHRARPFPCRRGALTRWRAYARRLLGTVDLSIQELQLKTHAVAGGLYLSHMAVSETARRRGIGRALLAAASECAVRRGEECIYLHVEPHNDAAIGLYEGSGFRKQAEVAPYVGFTRALNLQERAVLYRNDQLPR